MERTTWGSKEFGHAQLGHGARTKRLVQMVDRAMEQPQGSIAKTYREDKEREGAYRFIESKAFTAAGLERARGIACARRLQDCGGLCPVAVDQTSVRMHDRKRQRGGGAVGNRKHRARGLQVITALAMDPEGCPQGVLSQTRWARSEKRGPVRKPGSQSRKKKDRRPAAERESRYWLPVIEQAVELAQQHAPRARLWAQLDQGADFHGVYTAAADNSLTVTVRACHQRKIYSASGRPGLLKDWLKTLPRGYRTDIELPRRDGRPPRLAKLAVRYGQANVEFKTSRSTCRVLPLYYVEVRELWPAASVKEPLHWLLATTYPVHNREDAQQVIRAYKLRWRIEELHRAWKSGACNVEKAQLQSREAFERWAIITSSMAARVEQLKHLSRHSPQAPSSSLLSQEEIDAMIAVRHLFTVKAKPPYRPGDDPPIAEMTRWIASLGGHKSGPGRVPGTVVLTRGMEALQAFVIGIRAARQLEDSG